MKPNYLIQDVTGRIYPYAEGIADRADMKPYEMPVEAQEAGSPSLPVEEGQGQGAPTELSEPVVDPAIAAAAQAQLDSAQAEAEKTAKLLEENAALQAQIDAMKQEKAAETPDAPEDMAAEERIAKIKAAVESVPVENYGAPYAGKPAMPKVKDVSDAAGFKVYADEIGLVMGLNML